MSEDKHLKEREKLEAEISRSLSVAKMKAAHKQIEEIEKSRKRSVILSTIERLDVNITLLLSIMEELNSKRNEIPKDLRNKQISINTSPELNYIVSTYESIYFDFQKSTGIKPEDLNKLFPKIVMDFSTFTRIVSTIACIGAQMMDMKAYCLRLL